MSSPTGEVQMETKWIEVQYHQNCGAADAEVAVRAKAEELEPG